MKAISLHQPWASLCVTRQPCDACEGGTGYVAESCDERMVKRFETRSWPCPPKLIGSRVLIHATQREPERGEIGAFTVLHSRDVMTGETEWLLWYPPGDEPDPLPLGAIVGAATIEACYPIVHWSEDDEEQPACITVGHNDGRIYAKTVGPWGALDISDQLPYGDCRPGRYAWLLTDAAPVTERCPWCWGEHFEPDLVPTEGCHLCYGAGRCDPIPAKGAQRIWNWVASGAQA